MAKAFSPKIEEVIGNGDGTFTVNVLVVYSGSEVPTGTDLTTVPVTIDGSDNIINIRNKISNAILTKATSLGYSLVSNNIILLDFQKGN